MSENGNYQLSHTELVVMGLVSEEREEGIHGTSINKKIEERGMRKWTYIGKSSIYGVLKVLENNQLVSSWNEKIDNKRVRKYKTTDFGYKVFKQKVFDTLNNFKGRRSPNFDVAFGYMWILTYKEKIDAFKNSLKILKRDKKMLEGMFEENRERELNVKGLFVRPIKLIETHIEFINWVLSELNKEND